MITGRNQERLDKAQSELSSESLTVRGRRLFRGLACAHPGHPRPIRAARRAGQQPRGVKIAPVDEMEDEAIRW